MAFIGRKLKIYQNDNVIAGIREKTIPSTSQMIDVTDVNSEGFREIHNESGELAYDVNISGVTRSLEIRDAINNGDTSIKFDGCKVVFEDGFATTGDVILTGLTEQCNYKDVIQFDSQLSFSGEII